MAAISNVDNGNAVYAQAPKPGGVGVKAISSEGTGVLATSTKGRGVWATSTSHRGVGLDPSRCHQRHDHARVDVTPDSFVLLTAKANIGSRSLYFSTDSTNNLITIRMSSSRTSSTSIAWLLLR